MESNANPTPLGADLILGFRFSVTFWEDGTDPNLLDIRFQKVSGLSAEVDISPCPEGGQNLYTQMLPNKISYGRLSLERGMVIGSPLNWKFEEAMSKFKFCPSNVQVMLFGEDYTMPLASWKFLKAFPVRWAIGPLDAEQEKVLIDMMELAYTRMEIMRI